MSDGAILRGEDLEEVGIEKECPECGEPLDWVDPPAKYGRIRSGYVCNNDECEEREVEF